MNELINDLAIKAGINLWSFKEVGFASVEEHELEEFADLIIEECIKAFETEANTWKQLNHLQSAVLRKGSSAIKKHFVIAD